MAAETRSGGYRGFGSFHSENVEEMISLEMTQVETEVPETAELRQGPKPKFGLDMRKHFLLDFEKWTFLNHGAFGGPLKFAHSLQWDIERQAEGNPVHFIDRELFSRLVLAHKHLARLLNARPQDVAMMPNATVALNTVISSISFEPGQRIVVMNLGYGSVKRMLKRAAARSGAIVDEVQVSFPIDIDPQQLVSKVAEAMDSYPGHCTLAVFDFITSNSAIRMPIEALVQEARSRGILSLVDGAHAPGMTALDLTRMDADFFVGNLHKHVRYPNTELW